MKYLIPCMLLCAFLASAAPCRATTINWVGGTYGNWATSWTAINGLNDPADQGTNYSYDLVGDVSNPVAQYATNTDYYMFRMQLAVDTITSSTAPNNSYSILINIPGGTLPDYALSWDAASTYPASTAVKHGLEMQVYKSGTTWGTVDFNDIDGLNADKGVNDINGGTRTPVDGYVRTVDSQSSTNFGTVTYIDFAISKNYLNYIVGYTGDAYTVPSSFTDINTWNIQFGVIANSNDHNTFTDIGGGMSLSSTITDSDTSQNDFANVADAPAVPEPGTFMLMGSGLLGLLGYRRRGSLLAYFRR